MRRCLTLLTAGLLSCGPSPTVGDAGLVQTPARDATRSDAYSIDNAPHDAEGDESGARDRVVADGPRQDAWFPDSAAFDQGRDAAPAADVAPLPDASRADVPVFFGPYLTAAGVLPKFIADAESNGSPRSTDTAIVVPSPVPAQFVSAYATIAHADPGDLVVQLIPPLGATTQLFNGDSCNNPTPCSTSFIIDVSRIAITAGTQGSWILHITDRRQSQTGTLQTYSLSFAP